jgi:hypothetical protein
LKIRRITHLNPAASRSIGIAVLVSCLALRAGFVRADVGDAPDVDGPAFAEFRRQVIVSEILIAPLGDFPSPAALRAVLHRLATHTIAPADGFWRFHVLAFMDPSPDTAQVWAVLTDVTEPDHPREIKLFEMNTEPGARELAASSFVLTEAMGFEHGHVYELAVTRGGDEARNGKAAVLARGVVTLK